MASWSVWYVDQHGKQRRDVWSANNKGEVVTRLVQSGAHLLDTPKLTEGRRGKVWDIFSSIATPRLMLVDEISFWDAFLDSGKDSHETALAFVAQRTAAPPVRVLALKAAEAKRRGASLLDALEGTGMLRPSSIERLRTSRATVDEQILKLLVSLRAQLERQRRNSKAVRRLVSFFSFVAALFSVCGYIAIPQVKALPAQFNPPGKTTHQAPIVEFAISAVTTLSSPVFLFAALGVLSIGAIALIVAWRFEPTRLVLERLLLIRLRLYIPFLGEVWLWRSGEVIQTYLEGTIARVGAELFEAKADRITFLNRARAECSFLTYRLALDEVIELHGMGKPLAKAFQGGRAVWSPLFIEHIYLTQDATVSTPLSRLAERQLYRSATLLDEWLDRLEPRATIIVTAVAVSLMLILALPALDALGRAGQPNF